MKCFFTTLVLHLTKLENVKQKYYFTETSRRQNKMSQISGLMNPREISVYFLIGKST